MEEKSLNERYKDYKQEVFNFDIDIQLILFGGGSVFYGFFCKSDFKFVLFAGGSVCLLLGIFFHWKK
jgi:hypothetical protein